ncbi:MAG: flavin reductase [Thermoplasmata archaeon]|nr:flavin reductase [Thermoplasmata archaeon]
MDPKTLHKISYGLYVVCSRDGERINGQIANSLFQVTAEPPQIAVSVNKENLTHEYIEESGCFSVSILSQDTPMKFIGNFGFRSGRDFNKFEGVDFEMGKLRVPMVLNYTVACVEAKVVDKIDVGTHTLFMAEVVDGKILNDSEPLTYEYYHKVKGGFSPKTAPTYRGMVDKKKGGEGDGKVCL